ncbi:MAG: glycosyltransferase family 2 protein [Ignavibacteria bacterium]|nr:glycosyltransferase family 2 protein [Ignavibacteria bacterium]
MHDKTDLSIVIVTWNSEDEISECLNSIIENTKDLNYEIVIVENNSADNTADEIRKIAGEKFHRIKVILNNENLGYTRACNQGIESSSGRNVLLLNPDTIIEGEAIKALSDKLESNDNIGAAAPQLLNKDGSIQKSCRTFPDYFDMFCEFSLLTYVFPNSIIFSNWKMNYFNHNEERIVEQPMAAALMVKSKVLNEINNFDERYRMFFNDVDMCKKIYEKGYVIDFFRDRRSLTRKA